VPFIEMNMNEIQEAKPVANGMYELVIDECEEVESSKHQPMLKMRLSIADHADAPSVFNYQGLPTADDEPDKAKFKALMVKRLASAFGVALPDNGFDSTTLASELIGRRGRCELVQEEYNGQLSNKLKLPMLKESVANAAGKGSPPATKKR